MKITVLKDTIAASCPLGIKTLEYRAGQSYEIFDDLAKIFISEGWGKPEEKAIKEAPENKAIFLTPENKPGIISETESEQVISVHKRKVKIK